MVTRRNRRSQVVGFMSLKTAGGGDRRQGHAAGVEISVAFWC